MKSNYSKQICIVSVARKKGESIEFKLPKGSMSRDDITLYVDYVLTDKSQVVYCVWAQLDEIYLRGLLHCDEFQIKKDEDIIQKLLNHICLNKTVYERAETFISDFGM